MIAAATRRGMRGRLFAVSCTAIGITTVGMLSPTIARTAPSKLARAAASAASSASKGSHSRYPVAKTADEVLAFWFDELNARDGGKSWYFGSEEFDNELRQRFQPLLNDLVAGNLDKWVTEGDGKQTVAFILIADQISRNVYRGTPKAFATDDKAVWATREGLLDGRFEKLDEPYRQFAYMPLMHSEDIKMQELALEAFPTLPGFRADGEGQGYKFLMSHYDAIKRFGRYPHRNAILGRKSTPEEVEFLKDAESYGQTAKKTEPEEKADR